MNPGYSQILPLIILFTTIFEKFNYKNFLNLLSINLTIILPFLVISGTIRFSWEVFLSYIIAIIQFSSWIYLVNKSRDYKSLAINLNKVFLIFPYFLLTTQVIQIKLPPLYNLIELVKPYTQTVGQARGYPGILPEPGYVGPSLAVSTLCYFYSKNVIDIFHGKENFYILSRNFKVLSKFFIFISILSLTLSMSFASFISYVMIIFSFYIINYIPNLIKIKYTIKIKLITTLLIVTLVTFSSLSFLPKSSRIFYLAANLAKNPSLILTSGDESASDRFNSAFVGFVAPFFEPLGYGLNGYIGIFKNCNNPIPSSFNLMCENEFNSLRNNNVLANFTQDGGFLGLGTVMTLFLMNSKNILSIKRVLRISTLIIMGILLPFPLGASVYWILCSYILNEL